MNARCEACGTEQDINAHDAPSGDADAATCIECGRALLSDSRATDASEEDETPAPITRPRGWYYAIEKNRTGPVSEQDIRALYEDQTLSTNTLIWHPRMKTWTPMHSVPEFVDLIPAEESEDLETQETSDSDDADGENSAGNQDAPPESETIDAGANAHEDIFAGIQGHGSGETAERHDTSVLFSLDALSESDKIQDRGINTDHLTDTSGLIDLRAVAQNRQKMGGADHDSPFAMSIPEDSAERSAASFTTIPVPIVRRKRSKGPVLVILSLLLIGGATTGYLLYMRDRVEQQTPTAQVVMPDKPPEPTGAPPGTEDEGKPGDSAPDASKAIAAADRSTGTGDAVVMKGADASPSTREDSGPAALARAGIDAGAPDGAAATRRERDSTTGGQGNQVAQATPPETGSETKPGAPTKSNKAKPSDASKAASSKASDGSRKSGTTKKKNHTTKKDVTQKSPPPRKSDADTKKPPEKKSDPPQKNVAPAKTTANSTNSQSVNDLLNQLKKDGSDSNKSDSAGKNLPKRLAASTVQGTLRRKKGKFSQCYKKQPEPRASSVRVSTSFVIKSSGSVASARIVSAGGAAAGVQSCIIRVLKAVKFPPFKDPKMVVNYPIQLR